MIRLEHPLYMLLLFLFIPLFILFRKRASGLLYPSLDYFPVMKSWRIRFLFLPWLFYSLALAGFILTLARPVYIEGNSRESRKGIVLEMILDRSGSMGTWMDKQKNRNRLDIVKTTFLNFVNERPDDVIGLTVFARYADTMSPLTVSHGVFPDFMQTLHLADKEEDGTAIGEALALGVARIESYRSGRTEAPPPQSVIILLTDGQNNQGEIAPLEAADLAAEKGITVYTIGFGGGFYQNAFGFWEKIPPQYGLDETVLKGIADKTGGRYFNADDERALSGIYEQINKLEKTELEIQEFTRKDELFQKVLFLSLLLLLLAVTTREMIFPVAEGQS